MGTKYPTKTNRYLSSDGLYYNGYMGSPEAAEACFSDAMTKLKDALAAELGITGLDNEESE